MNTIPYTVCDGGICYAPEGHRAGYASEVREAMAVLDRAAEGEPVSPSVINRALYLTGDATASGLPRMWSASAQVMEAAR